ncbi:MAG: hypothetical protein ACRDOB_02435, partial [Streptosporangiaceae bacterium]
VLAGCGAQLKSLFHHPAGTGLEGPALANCGKCLDPGAGELDDEGAGREERREHLAADPERR